MVRVVGAEKGRRRETRVWANSVQTYHDEGTRRVYLKHRSPAIVVRYD